MSLNNNERNGRETRCTTKFHPLPTVEPPTHIPSWEMATTYNNYTYNGDNIYSTEQHLLNNYAGDKYIKIVFTYAVQFLSSFLPLCNLIIYLIK